MKWFTKENAESLCISPIRSHYFGDPLSTNPGQLVQDRKPRSQNGMGRVIFQLQAASHWTSRWALNVQGRAEKGGRGLMHRHHPMMARIKCEAGQLWDLCHLLMAGKICRTIFWLPQINTYIIYILYIYILYIYIHRYCIVSYCIVLYYIILYYIILYYIILHIYIYTGFLCRICSSDLGQVRRRERLLARKQGYSWREEAGDPGSYRRRPAVDSRNAGAEYAGNCWCIIINTCHGSFPHSHPLRSAPASSAPAWQVAEAQKHRPGAQRDAEAVPPQEAGCSRVPKTQGILRIPKVFPEVSRIGWADLSDLKSSESAKTSVAETIWNISILFHHSKAAKCNVMWIFRRQDAAAKRRAQIEMERRRPEVDKPMGIIRFWWIFHGEKLSFLFFCEKILGCFKTSTSWRRIN